MKNLSFQRRSVALFAATLLTLLIAGVSTGCGKKATDAPAPYANQKNPAAVAPATTAGDAPGSRGTSPEAEAYRQKMGANAKAPGAR